jgi:hypothetical protein
MLVKKILFDFFSNLSCSAKHLYGVQEEPEIQISPAGVTF